MKQYLTNLQTPVQSRICTLQLRHIQSMYHERVFSVVITRSCESKTSDIEMQRRYSR